MSATKEKLEPESEPEASAPAAEAFSIQVPAGFELSDLAYPLKLFSPDREFYPETMYKLQRLAANYRPEDLQVTYTGYIWAQVAMANRKAPDPITPEKPGRVIEDKFESKRRWSNLFRERLERTESNSFRVGTIAEELSSSGVAALVFKKPDAEPIRQRGVEKLGQVAAATELRLA